LVTKEPLRGYTATRLLDLPEFLQLYEMRTLLEPAAARKAAAMATEADLRILEQQVEAIEQARIARTNEQYHVFPAQDAAFHDTIARMAGNKYLRETLGRLHSHLQLYRLLDRTFPASETIDEHRAILVALRSGDSEAAATAMVDHIERSRARHRMFIPLE
jgi:DNA-binding GntR family transcriptional regulator